MAGQLVAMLVSNSFRKDTRAIKIGRSLVKRGYQVTVIAWNREGRGSHREEQEGMTVLRLGPGASYGRGLWQFPAFVLFLLRSCWALWRLRPEVIHCHRLDSLLVGAATASVRRTPLIYDPHMPFADRLLAHARQPGMAMVAALMNRAEKWLLTHLVCHCFTDGPLYTASLRDRGITQVSELLNVPPLAFGASVRPPPLPQEPPGFTFGRIGLISPQLGQGIEPLLELLARLRVEAPQLNPHLLLVGPIVPQSYKARIDAQLPGFAGAVTLSEGVPHAQVPSCYARLDVLVAVYDFSGPARFGAVGTQQKVFEAMASGIPLVVHSNPYVNSVVARAGCGLVAETSSTDALFRALLHLARHPEQRRQMGEAGRRAFLAQYHWESQEAELFRVYDQFS